jgi:hypothetical protein
MPAHDPFATTAIPRYRSPPSVSEELHEECERIIFDWLEEGLPDEFCLLDSDLDGEVDTWAVELISRLIDEVDQGVVCQDG